MILVTYSVLGNASINSEIVTKLAEGYYRIAFAVVNSFSNFVEEFKN